MAIALNAYLKKSVETNSVTELFRHYNRAVELFGYEKNVFIFFPPKQDASETIPCCPNFNIPEELIKIYLEHELYQIGPMFEKVKTSGRPVVWSSFLKNKKLFEKSPHLQEFIELLSGYGYKNGLTIPVYGARNCFGHFSFTSNKREIKENDEDTVLLSHICMNLLKQYRRITEVEDGIYTPLTPREKEVLIWVLKGKSNSVIGEIMGISEHTVNTYIKRSSKKLGASSKWSSAITAVLMGIIQY